MKKFFRKVVKSFKKLADAKLLTFGQNVTASMAAAIDVYPDPIPKLAAVNTELATYSDLLQTAKSRDKVQVALKNQSKKTSYLC